MKLELLILDMFCATDIFKINDIDADYMDFGKKFDRAVKNAQNYGCGNMRFTKIKPRKTILKKYRISVAEYNKIANELENGLSFRCCNRCA